MGARIIYHSSLIEKNIIEIKFCSVLFATEKVFLDQTSAPVVSFVFSKLIDTKSLPKVTITYFALDHLAEKVTILKIDNCFQKEIKGCLINAQNE